MNSVAPGILPPPAPMHPSMSSI